MQRGRSTTMVSDSTRGRRQLAAPGFCALREDVKALQFTYRLQSGGIQDVG
jgi:hypothetical protein